MKDTTITIAGDIYLGRGVEEIAVKNSTALFDPSVQKIFKSSDFNILNLESPITNCNNRHRILKTGPHLKASSETLKALDDININLVTLANNHIYDYGNEGLTDTFKHLEKANIDFTGAGVDLRSAQKTYYQQIGDFSIAVINFAENEWNSATDHSGGSNPLDIINNTTSIQQAKANADFTIVIVHGGHENYQYPSPRMVKQYRYFADQGADAVICHHAHRTSGYEVYNNVPIFYGIGNFLFNSNQNLPGWHNGLIVKLTLHKSKSVKWEIFPYQQCMNKISVELLEGEALNSMNNEIENINQVINNPDELNKAFNDFVASYKPSIMTMFSTSNIIDNHYFKAGIRKLQMERFFLRKKQLKNLFNYMRCEAHRDVTFKTLEKFFEN